MPDCENESKLRVCEVDRIGSWQRSAAMVASGKALPGASDAQVREVLGPWARHEAVQPFLHERFVSRRWEHEEDPARSPTKQKRMNVAATSKPPAKPPKHDLDLQSSRGTEMEMVIDHGALTSVNVVLNFVKVDVLRAAFLVAFGP